MKSDDLQRMEREIAAAMLEGAVSIPFMLLNHYRKLQLSDTEAMLLVHLIAFKEKEGKEFPTIEELQERMSAPPERVIEALQRLIKEKFLTIDEETDPVSGIHYERYNLLPAFLKLAAVWHEEYGRGKEAAASGYRQWGRPRLPDRPGEEEYDGRTGKGGAGRGNTGRGDTGRGDIERGDAERETPDLFTVFENEFARPLTPMECETISAWLDKDRYPEELILAALKEAVFAGKVHFRYIDRILLDWKRNRIFTVEQAKDYAQRFRGGRMP